MRITVVGDTLLDRDLGGPSLRVSPDAQVPVINITQRLIRAGGAGLVARMLASDGHQVQLVTALSGDRRGALLRDLLRGISVVAGSTGAQTPTKTRIRLGDEPICRVDEGCDVPPIPRLEADVLEAVSNAQAILVSDYGRRITSHQELRRTLQRRAREIPILWDPHPRGMPPVPGVELITPNLDEAAAASGLRSSPAEAARAAQVLRKKYRCVAAAVTLGAGGAVLDNAHGTYHLHGNAVTAADVCGAGDRFAATAMVTLAQGGASVEAVQAGVRAAGTYLRNGGVAALQGPPEVPIPGPGTSALELARQVRDRGQVLVATGGCFDLLHAGHVRTLEAARALGDFLIVLLNSDASVRRLKGPDRPLMGYQDRVRMLESLSCVDAVHVFDEDDPMTALQQIRPQFWVKGGDYRHDALPERALVERWGGRVVTMPYHLGRSTSHLVRALAEAV